MRDFGPTYDDIRVKSGGGGKHARCQLCPQHRKCAALPGTSEMCQELPIGLGGPVAGTFGLPYAERRLILLGNMANC